MRLKASLLLLLVSSVAFAAEKPEPAPMPANALAMIAIRQQGGSFDRLVNWCGKVVSNSGALARQTLSTALFPIPAQDGVDPEAPAVVFYLDTQANLADGLGDQAVILGVKDAKALKDAIKAVFGGEEQDGMLHASIPQGFDKPERKLVIRVDSKWAWVAPDETALKALTEAAGAKGAGAFLAPDAPDAAIRLNLDLLRRQHKPELEKVLGLAGVLGGKLAPQFEGDLNSARAKVLDRTRELETLELRFSFNEDALIFAAQVKALAGTDLFMAWSRKPGGTPSSLPLALPGEAALALHTCPREVVHREPRAGPPDEPAKQDCALCAALVKLQALADGGAGVAAVSTETGAARLVVALGASDPAQAEAALKEALDAVVKFSCDCARPMMKLKDGDPAPFELQPLPEQEVAGTKVRGFQIGMPDKYKLLPALEKIYTRTVGWPVPVRYAVTKQGMLVASGKDCDAALKAALEKAASEKEGAAAKLPAGISVSVELMPVAVLRALLNAALDPDAVDAAQFTEKLEDAPIKLGAGAADGCGSVRLNLPAKAVKAVTDLYFKLERANIDPFNITLPDAAMPAQAVPAPPPGP
ncbi:MAG: hypothetical protein HY291_23960 [Planctomycetes bacterium]|nr:hypothetical protein [Planctomycetota bacterium]